MGVVKRCAVPLVSCLLALSVLMAQQQPSAILPADEATDYVVQSLCLDAADRTLPLTPVDTGCTRRRPQLRTDTAAYRKHDWPNKLTDASRTSGYQASDSVLEPGPQPLSIQTFDFGGDGRTFGRFDDGKGDGGQILMFVQDWASLIMTEDGTGGIQWFVGSGCGERPHSTDRFLSWLVFRRDADENWRSRTAHLNIAKHRGACPARWNAAYTRYRSDRLELGFNVSQRGEIVRTARPRLDAIVSEHYGGAEIATADHLERFFYAKGLGLVRWERWANGNLPQENETRAAHRALIQTDRCPRIEHYGAPQRRWMLVDCRTWTNLILQDGNWSVASFGWPSVPDIAFDAPGSASSPSPPSVPKR